MSYPKRRKAGSIKLKTSKKVDDIDIDIDACNNPSSEESSDDTDINGISKHTIEGKHTLKYDSIFKGKTNDDKNVDSCVNDYSYNDTIELDSMIEPDNEEQAMHNKLVSEKIYEVLTTCTDINLTSTRRKPSKEDFNYYFEVLKKELMFENFTKSEIFIELSFYFSDNIFNMYRLLTKEHRNEVFYELESYVNKKELSKEVDVRNIQNGVEVEFKWINELDDSDMVIDGVVVECNTQKARYKIDSYKKIYDIGIKDIIKILNNKRIMYNLTKLENIDLF